ncbi:helix-turn-helix domain-containing protein [Echinicola sp. CAU 1574]|uniref:Helix-turn-helix domain-containing protein n=1 Tax=Echinicola arenosa TaxID=2774144 RepID=A0ABR9AIH1_9BACT|nr:helix-turn-helix domain-containing protein [Echinicola arenosa]MBD8488639.1 helix-turn-helix domain-containing protein [Echinicola arenosa]
MKNVSIVIPRGHFSLVNIEGTYQIFSWVNGWLVSQGKPPYFKLQLVGLSKPAQQSTGLYEIHPEKLIEEVNSTDLIVIPAIHGDFDEVIEANADFMPWIIKNYKRGSEVASLCIGCFFLAATGLLDGKQCATHWQFANEFRKRFPQSLMVDDKIITDSDGLYTSGGAFSFTNLLIYLIEKYLGREVAVMAAKSFMIDIDRESQSHFILFTGQKEHHDEEILKAQKYIEKNFMERITVDELAQMFGVGRRSLERRFKNATSNTVVEYIQRVKMEAAKQELEKGRKTVNEVMYDVGYSDSKAFRGVFKKITGLSPIQYRDKYALSRIKRTLMQDS